MAIDRVAIPTPTAPVALADYQAQLDQITALNQAFTGRNIVDSSTIHAGCVMMIGGVLYKSTTDTTITGTPSKFVKITPSGATAAAAFVASLSGVAWNHAYGGYYDGSGNLYLFDEARAVNDGDISTAYTTQGQIAYIKGGLDINGALTGATRIDGTNIAHAVEKLTGSGTWTCPSGVTRVKVICGGGGGNGGNGSGTIIGGGGGGGGLSISFLTVVPGSGYSYSVGGAASNSFFGSIIGYAGQNANEFFGGAGGAAIGGGIAGSPGIDGGAGGNGGGGYGGAGDAGLGGPHGAGAGLGGGNGTAGYVGAAGGGGGGGGTSAAGGAGGAAGSIIIEY